jgi:hypothetical protein
MSLKARLKAAAKAAYTPRRAEFWVQTEDRQKYERLGREGDPLTITPEELAERKQQPGVAVLSFDLAPERRERG